MVAYADAAQERVAETRRADFHAMVEAVRAGSIFAHDQRQYERWQRAKPAPQRPKGLTGAALERAVMAFAQANPEYVVYGRA